MGNENQKAEWTLGLKDELTDVALSAAGALEKLQSGIDADTRALAGMQKAMKNLQLGGVTNVADGQKLKAQMDERRASIVKAQAAYLNLGGTFNKANTSGKGFAERVAALTKQTQAATTSVTKTNVASKALAGNFGTLSKVTQGMPGPLGGLAGKLGQLRGLLAGGVIALGIIAIVAALAALVAATGAAIVALAKYGLAQADARRSEGLRLESLTKMRMWYQRIPGNAKEMQASIDRVSASVASSREEVEGYNEHLYRLGLRGQNLSTALEAYSVAQSAGPGGKQAAEWFAGMAATAQMAGGSVKKLADDIKGRFGEIAARRMLSLDVQAKKLRESFAALFVDVKIEPVLKAFKSLTDLFGQSTATGRALKSLMTSLLQPLLGQMTDGAPIVKRFFQGIVLAALRVTNTVLEMRLAWKKAFGDKSAIDGLDKLRMALLVGKAVMYTTIALFGILGGVVAACVYPFVAFGQQLLVAWDLGMKVIDWFFNIDWSGLGKSVLDGILGGLNGAADMFSKVFGDLADSATKAFQEALGIASPSKVFAELGLQIPRGITVGVNAGAPGARAAVADVIPPSLDAPSTRPSVTPRVAASPAAVPAVPAVAPSMPAGGGGNTFHFGDIVIHSDSDKPDELAVDIKREIERVLEGVALQLGAPVPGGA